MRDGVLLHNFGMHRQAILDMDKRVTGTEVRIRVHEDMVKGWCAIPWLAIRSVFWPRSIENEIRQRWMKYADEAEAGAGVKVDDAPLPDGQTDAAVRAALEAAAKAPEGPEAAPEGPEGPDAP